MSSSHVSVWGKLGMALYFEIQSQIAAASFDGTKSLEAVDLAARYRTKGSSLREANTVAILVAIIFKQI
jgi:hypothetical protein